MGFSQFIQDNDLKSLTLTLMVFFCSLGVLQSAENGSSAMKIEKAIAEIESEVIDLTSVQVLLQCKEFLSFRKGLTEVEAGEIVHLIHQKKLTGVQSQIGLYAIARLPEEIYWKVTKPLLSAKTESAILEDVLSCPFPYGPAYANAYKSQSVKSELRGVQIETSLSARNRESIQRILSGAAAETYRKFLKNPEDFGYSKDLFKP